MIPKRQLCRLQNSCDLRGLASMFIRDWVLQTPEFMWTVGSYLYALLKMGVLPPCVLKLHHSARTIMQFHCQKQRGEDKSVTKVVLVVYCLSICTFKKRKGKIYEILVISEDQHVCV